MQLNHGEIVILIAHVFQWYIRMERTYILQLWRNYTYYMHTRTYSTGKVKTK